MCGKLSSPCTAPEAGGSRRSHLFNNTASSGQLSACFPLLTALCLRVVVFFLQHRPQPLIWCCLGPQDPPGPDRACEGLVSGQGLHLRAGAILGRCPRQQDGSSAWPGSAVTTGLPLHLTGKMRVGGGKHAFRAGGRCHSKQGSPCFFNLPYSRRMIPDPPLDTP